MSTEWYDLCENGYESNCCGAAVIWTDICNACGEHCEPICVDDNEEEVEI